MEREYHGFVPANPIVADSAKSTREVMESLHGLLATLQSVSTCQALSLLYVSAIIELDNVLAHLKHDKQLIDRGVFVTFSHDNPLGNYEQWKTALKAYRSSWNKASFKDTDSVSYAIQGLDFEMLVGCHHELKKAVIERMNTAIRLLDDMQHTLNQPTQEQLVNLYNALKQEYIANIYPADHDKFKRSMLGVLPTVKQNELKNRLSELETQLGNSGFFGYLTGESKEERQQYNETNKEAVAGYIVRYRNELSSEMIIAFFRQEKMKNDINEELNLCRKKENEEKIKEQLHSHHNKHRVMRQTGTTLKPTSATFEWHGDEKERKDRLKLLYNGLRSRVIRGNSLIDNDTDFNDLDALFQGKPCKTSLVIRWTGSKQHLAYFFKSISKLNNISLPKGESLWMVVRSHFVDAQGMQFSDDLHDQHPPLGKSLCLLNTLVDLMNTNKSIQEVIKEFKSAFFGKNYRTE